MSRYNKRLHTLLLSITLLLLSQTTLAGDPIRLGILKFGTVNWELSAMQSLELDKQYGIELEIRPFASLSATKIALKSGTVDVIVSDWLWINLQRSKGDLLQMLPYSSAIGSLMVASDSAIEKIEDLKGKRIGIAGGPQAKGWVLLQAAARQAGYDLKQESSQKFGAPPLLSESLKRGQLDAAMTYWHFAARLKASDLKNVLPLRSVQRQLGMEKDIPMLGYVFHQTWAQKHPQTIRQFAKAVAATKKALTTDIDAWNDIRPLMKLSSEREFEFLRQGYIDGTPEPMSKAKFDDAKRFFELMQASSDDYRGSHFDAKSFWQPDAH